MADKKTNLIWIDLEMTGLSPSSDRILEIATIVTDAELNIIATGPELVINQTEKLLKNMDEWCINQHTNSGLVERVLRSDITEAQAEQQTLEFLMKYVDAKCSPMCGNTICMDRRFLHAYMPNLEAFFHYRHLDVSTIKILVKNWAPQIAEGFTKQSSHRALDDVKDSIDELKYYRKHVFNI